LNTLYYGDNLSILREHIPGESVDLVYLDPPFNSSRSYNVLFRDESGHEADAQIAAFEDTWHWNAATEKAYYELVTLGEARVSGMISALRQSIGTNQMMAYLVMMAARLVELHRVLKPTGSLYLHCDPTAGHYLKIVLDTIFGPRFFRNEVIWKRSSAHSDTKQGAKQAGRIHDLLFFYTKSDDWTWNGVCTAYSEVYVKQFYRHVEPGTGRRFRVDNLTAAKPGGDTSYEWRVKRPVGSTGAWQADLHEEYRDPKPDWEYKGVPPYMGRFWAYSYGNMVEYAKQGRIYYSESGMPNYKRYLDEMPGVPLQDIWDDIPPISGGAVERLGYPTQKPLALLERIISASSNPGDLVLDPFCGCGTAIAAAQKLGRQWIGIDITHLSIALMKYRLKGMFGLVEKRDYAVIGEPQDLPSAHQLAQENRYQFQWWALSLVKARPVGSPSPQPLSREGRGARSEGKKGRDKGIDGVIAFIDDASGQARRILVQVKSGHVKSSDLRDLHGTIDREGAAMGVFLTLDNPTRDMEAEAAAAGLYHSPGWDRDYPKLQILTIADLLNGAEVKMPPAAVTFKQAERVGSEGKVKQEGLF